MSVFSKLSVTLLGLHPSIKVFLLSGQFIASRRALTPPNEGPNQDEKEQFDAKGASEGLPHFLVYGGNALKVGFD